MIIAPKEQPPGNSQAKGPQKIKFWKEIKSHQRSKALRHQNRCGKELVRMTKIKKGNLTIDFVLFDFVNQEVIPGIDVDIEDFWNKFDLAVHELALINKALIDTCKFSKMEN